MFVPRKVKHVLFLMTHVVSPPTYLNYISVPNGDISHPFRHPSPNFLRVTVVPMSGSSKLTSSGESMFTCLIKSNEPLGLLAGPDCDALGNAIEDTLMPLTFPPLEALPCINHCSNPGKLPCGRCKLVSYCSQVRLASVPVPDW